MNRPYLMPNPGADVAFDLGLPYLTLDHQGRTHVSRNPVELHIATTERSDSACS